MSGFNCVILQGNLGVDPEVHHTQAGAPIVTFSMATSESWKDKATGEKREATEWHRVVIFSEPLCKIAEQYLKKGSKVLIEGALRTRKWTHSDGGDRWSTEVVLTGFNSRLVLTDRADRAPTPSDAGYGARAEAPSGAPSPAAGRTSSAPRAGKRPDLDDEIPF